MGGWSCRALVAAVTLWTFVSGTHAAPLEEALIPLDRYTSEKGRLLATTYSPELRDIFDNVARCLPWLSVFKQGLGFRKPRWIEGDDRYLSIWVWVDQQITPAFASLSATRRASAMFSRYGVDLLRRLSNHTPLLRDPNLTGYAVAVSWLKPNQSPKVDESPVAETLAVFIDKVTVQGFFAQTLTPAQLLEDAIVAVFDGTRRLGRLALEVWEDSLTATFKGKGASAERECQ